MTSMRSIRAGWAALATACILALPTAGAFAQTVTCNIPGNGNNQECDTAIQPVAFTIARTVRLTVVQGTNFSLLPTGGLLSTSHYDAGYYDAAGVVQLQVSANASWTARIAATATSFSTGCPTKAASDLKWGTTSAVRNTVVSNTPATVFSGASATALQSQDVYFRVSLAWASDAPVTTSSNCKLPVSFSATSP